MTLDRLLESIVRFVGALLVLSMPQVTLGGEYDFLDEHERTAPAWTPEITESIGIRKPPLSADLSEYYKEFERDGIVTFYVGYGYEAFFEGRGATLYNMLISLSGYYGLRLGHWSFDGTTIRFKDLSRGTNYLVTIGDSRNGFASAFGSHEVVMYHGHSRYGRGPSFGNFTNYFRMGSVFDAIEVDTRSSSFLREPMLLTDQFPARPVYFNGYRYDYQYRGQKHYSSYLPADSFTKNIPGRDVDLRNTKFLPGRQIFYFYSCKNMFYFEKPIRALFPNAQHKFVFGTDEDAYGGTKPDAVMIMSVVRKLSRSDYVLQGLLATQDCNECFTAY